MTALTKVSPLIVASAMFLTGCALTSPELYIDPFSATGKPSPCFARGEVPAIYYNIQEGQTSGFVIKLRQQPTGITVRRMYFPGIGFPDFADPVDHPTRFELAEKIRFPGLFAGNYTAELWMKGQVVNTLNFSVSEDPVHADRASVQRNALAVFRGMGQRHPEATKFYAIKHSADRSVDELDATVGLSAEQETAAEKIYLTQSATLQAFSSIEERAEKGIAIRQETKTKIRGLLTPEQQKHYDDGCSAGRSADGVLERLNQLVGLTPAQEVEVEKILADQNLALDKFASLEDRAQKGPDIRQQARAQIRALLTPAQQKIYDETPERLGGGSMHDPDDPMLKQLLKVRAYIGNLIKGSAPVAARIGTITRVTPAENPDDWTFMTSTASEEMPDPTAKNVTSFSSKGHYRFDVRGSERTEQLTVYWEKPSASAPIAIVKIEDSTGKVIPL